MRTALVFVLLAGAAAPAGAAPAWPTAPIRGMTVSCPWWGEVWGTHHMEVALRELSELGVEWVALHPYARVRRDGSIQAWPAAEVGYLSRAVELAAQSQTQLFWTPHLAHWGSFSWRGAIDFGADEAAWSRFFAGYERFIVDQARFAERARVPLLSVGVELERTVHREREWRRIIRAVRSVYRGRLTYSANWDGFARVPFWDALDLIGVQAYFPLAPEAAPEPSVSEIEAAWTGHLERLRTLSRQHGDKPVLFTELGFSRSSRAATQPWLPRVDEEPAVLRLRQRLLETSLSVVERTPWVAGLFFWKWIPGQLGAERDFSMRDPEARAVLRSRWARARPSRR